MFIDSRTKLKNVIILAAVGFIAVAAIFIATLPLFNTSLGVNSTISDITMRVNNTEYSLPVTLNLKPGDYPATFYAPDYKHEERKIHVGAYGKTNLDVSLTKLKIPVSDVAVFNGELGYEISTGYNDFFEPTYTVTYADEAAKKIALEILKKKNILPDKDIIILIEESG